jgi:hypothetical protein
MCFRGEVGVCERYALLSIRGWSRGIWFHPSCPVEQVSLVLGLGLVLGWSGRCMCCVVGGVCIVFFWGVSGSVGLWAMECEWVGLVEALGYLFWLVLVWHVCLGGGSGLCVLAGRWGSVGGGEGGLWDCKGYLPVG